MEEERNGMPTGVAVILEFLQGLAFFVLGLFILLAAPRVGRVNIIRRLPLLALFAFGEAAAAWTPVLTAALSFSSDLTALPLWLRAGFLSLGGWGLLAWGLVAPLPAGRDRRLLAFLLLLLFFWLAVLFIAAVASPYDPAAHWARVAARGLLILPGGLMAARGLNQPSFPSDTPVLQAARHPLRRVGTVFAAFAILAGGIYPLFFFPGLTALSAPFLAVLSGLLTLCGVGMIYGLVRVLNIVQQEVEEWVENVRQSQALTADRERISRELHDGIIQSIYAAGLILEGARALIPEDPDAAQVQLTRAMQGLNQTIQDIRRYIFNLRGVAPEADLVTELEQLLRDFRINTLLETRLIVFGEARDTLTAERRQHILQIVREALANVARHAHARRVEVHLSYTPRALQLQIADDGVGLAMIPTTTGQGLRNIRERARLLEGTLDIDSAPGQGVTITLTVPYLRGEL